MGVHRALATVLLLSSLASSSTDCLSISDVSVSRPDAYALQLNSVSFTVSASSSCPLPRSVEAAVTLPGGFAVLGDNPVRASLAGPRTFSFSFYPTGSASGAAHVQAVATDWTEEEPRMAGRKAELYVANPLAQWWYWAGAACLALGWRLRRRLADELEPSPLPLLVGAYLLYRSYILATRRGALADLFAGPAVPPGSVAALELALLGLLLAAFGRPASEAARRGPATALVALVVLLRVLPTDAWLHDDLALAWRERSLAPLREELLLVAAPPALALDELGRLHPLAPYRPALALGLGLPLTALYWRWLARLARAAAEPAAPEGPPAKGAGRGEGSAPPDTEAHPPPRARRGLTVARRTP